MEGLVDLSLFEWNPAGTSTAHGVSSGTADYYQPVLSGTKEYYAPSPREETTDETDDLREAIRRSITDTTGHRPDTRQQAPVCEESDIREFVVDASRRRERHMKPLPALPRTRIVQQAAGDGSERTQKQIKETSADQAILSPGSLLQRRIAHVTPQLTLSVPNESPRPSNSDSHQDHSNPSPMVWMPDEQMWLVVGEAEQRSAHDTEAAYPTPPAYTPRAGARSEPSSRVTSQWDLTPPQTPIQSQLQSLLQPRDEELPQSRDEERLSPLFHEAMNSVPMTDHFDLPPPPSYEGTIGRSSPAQFRPYTSVSERFLSSTSQLSSASPVVHRAQTTGSQRPRVRSDTSSDRSNSQRSYCTLSTDVPRTSNGGRSYHSTSTSRSYQSPADLSSVRPCQPIRVATRPWHGLAQRLVRSRSTT